MLINCVTHRHSGGRHGQRALRRGYRQSLACENHSLDVPWWGDLVEGIDKPVINKGWIKVPDKPGLGITLNEEVVRQHLAPGTGYLSPRRNGTRSVPATGSGARCGRTKRAGSVERLFHQPGPLKRSPPARLSDHPVASRGRRTGLCCFDER